MKHDEPFSEIGDLLRSHKPDPRPSPGLESRIVRALDRREPRRSRVWPWFLLPPAVALAMVMLWPESPGPAATVVQQNAAPQPVESPEPATRELNPLQAESRALRHDAERAGRFLIDCLPSFSEPSR